MASYYNEFDPYAAQWLRNLIKAGLIADGEVDERSIHLVRPDDVRGFTQCHFFAGIGGWSLALRLAGIADDQPVWTGSCPCQPFSAAGRQRGFADERHLWPVFRNLIAECRPASFLGEQVASATEWLRLVRGDLEALDYAVGAIPVEAASAGADHKRDRYWIVAHADLAGTREGREQRGGQFGGAGGDSEACDVEYALRIGWPAGRCDHRDDGRAIPSAAGERTVADARSSGLEERERHAGISAKALGSSAGQDFAHADQRGHVKHATSIGRREGRAETEFRSGRTAAPGTGLSCGAVAAASQQRRDRCGSARPEGWPEYSDVNAWGGMRWIAGADGKARRIPGPGIRLLAHGVSGRVAVRRTAQQGQPENEEEEIHWYNRIGALRGFGNAIDPRPAAAFIRAAMEIAP